MLQTHARGGGHQHALDFFEQLGCGCILIDSLGRVLRVNEYASRYIGRELAISNQRLAASNPNSNAILQRLITAALIADTNFEVAPGLLALHRDGHPLVLRVTPVVGSAHPAFPGAKAIVTLTDTDDCQAPPEEVLRASFGLTPAEARLATRIACGDGLEEIAERHQVSVGTVRAQLRAVFLKTQTNRQAQLVALLARLGRLR